MTEGGFYGSHDPHRERRVLATKGQIRHFMEKSVAQGLDVVPSRLLFNAKGLVKLDVVVAKRKPPPDKREKMARQQGRAEVSATMS